MVKVKRCTWCCWNYACDKDGREVCRVRVSFLCYGIYEEVMATPGWRRYYTGLLGC